MADLDPSRLVFVDETWIKTNMAPLRGWGARGKRLKGYAPHGHWRTMTFIAALRCDRLDAPCVFDGPINGQCLRAWIDQQLVATLKPGDIVVLDNLGSHKAKAVRQTIRAADARLWFLPPYSPDLNPTSRCMLRIHLPGNDRTGLRQDQALDADGTETQHGRHMASSGKPHQDNPTARMCKLSGKRRICFSQNLTRSSGSEACT